jgi:thiamine biosynthesis lipoprotein
MLGIGVATVGLGFVSSEALKFSRKHYKVSQTRLSMKTFVSMTLIHASKDEAEEAMGRAYEEIDRLVRLMNRFDKGSVVSQLNASGLIEETPMEVLEVIDAAKKFHNVSAGTFDITVLPILELFNETVAQKPLVYPSELEIKAALECVGLDKMEVRGKTIRLTKTGMGVTLDGIAKGYIVDRASQVLTAHNIEDYLINAGGDIKTRGSRLDKRPWQIAIQEPGQRNRYNHIIHMNNGAIATSGNYEVYYDEEKMFHHIVDSESGLSPRESASVSIFAPRTIAADALSTGVFVMDPLSGVSFIDALPHFECLMIMRDGKEFSSKGWKNIRA